MSSEEVEKLFDQIEKLEQKEESFMIHYLVEKALYDSSLFKVGKWVAMGVSILLVIAIFWGNHSWH